MFFPYLVGTIAVLFMIAWFIGFAVKPSLRRRRFRVTFGIQMPRDRDMHLLYNLVFRELSKRATAFHDLDMVERELQSTDLPSNPQEVQQALDDLVHLSREVKKRRAAFWSAHKVAADVDFVLPTSYEVFLKNGARYVPFEETVSEEA